MKKIWPYSIQRNINENSYSIVIRIFDINMIQTECKVRLVQFFLFA